MTRAISYIRFSSIQQGSGDSLRRQLDLTHAYCHNNKLTLDETLSFRDLGVSGFHLQNIKTGAFGLLLDAIKAGRIVPGDYILVENLDRISRANVLDAFGIFSSILQNGITIVTLSDGKVYTKDSCNDIGNIILSILTMVRAYEESAMKSQRGAAAWTNKREQAKSGTFYTNICPGWLRVIDNKFEIIKERAELVERIFSMSLNGRGAILIAKELNHKHIPAWKSESTWQLSSVKKLLHNPAVYGDLVPGKMNGGKRETLNPIEGYYPVIISKDTFLAAQYAISQRTGKGGKPGASINIFKALLRCPKCKGSITRLNRGVPTRAVFCCERSRRGASDCKYKPWAVEEVERIILEHLTELDLGSIFKNSETKLQQLRSSIYATRKSLEGNQLKAERLVNLLTEGAANSPTLVSKLNVIESEISELRTQLESLVATEQSERDNIAQASIAQDDIRALMNHNDREMRIRLQSAVRHLVSSILLHLDIKKIAIRYKARDIETYSKVIFRDGKSIRLNHDDVGIELVEDY